MPKLYGTSAAKREVPVPSGLTEETLRQKSGQLKEEILTEVQKTVKEQNTSLAESVAAMKTMLQQTLEKKDGTRLRMRMI